MNWRRYLLALAVTSVATLVTDVLLNAVVFREVYTRAAPFLLPPDQLNARIPLGWAALLVITATFGVLFAIARWQGIRDGLRFGALLAVAGIAGVAGLASVFAWPLPLLIAVSAQQTANALLLGAVFGLLYRSNAMTMAVAD
jgi:hypothetical protein